MSPVHEPSQSKLAKVQQKVLRKATGLVLDSVTIICGVEVDVENLVHAPHPTYAVVNAGEGILGAEVQGGHQPIQSNPVLSTSKRQAA
jgi:hypothetical protein